MSCKVISQQRKLPNMRGIDQCRDISWRQSQRGSPSQKLEKPVPRLEINHSLPLLRPASWKVASPDLRFYAVPFRFFTNATESDACSSVLRPPGLALGRLARAQMRLGPGQDPARVRRHLRHGPPRIPNADIRAQTRRASQAIQ